MDLKELKQQIENKDIHIGFSIFKYDDIDFLPYQYVNYISKINGLEIEYLDDLSTIINSHSDLFGCDSIATTLRVCKLKSFDITSEKLREESNLIVICKEVSKEAQEFFYQNIVEFPKLEEWQIKDYVYSLLEGVDTKKLDYLITLCNNNIYRLENEISKISIFSLNERKYVFDDFIDDGIFSDLSQYSIFNLTTALMKKDISAVMSIYKEIEKFDCEPLGLVTLLYQNIRNVISVQLSSNPSPESTGLPTKRFWAIKYMCGFYTKEQLMKLFDLVTSIDKQLKTGYITNDIIIDYLICNIMSV